MQHPLVQLMKPGDCTWNRRYITEMAPRCSCNRLTGNLKLHFTDYRCQTLCCCLIYRRWLTARIFPSVSLNHAVFAPPPVIMPFFIVTPGMSYSSNFTPRAFSSATSASTSLTCQNAWLALDVPALSVGYINTPVPPHS